MDDRDWQLLLSESGAAAARRSSAPGPAATCSRSAPDIARSWAADHGYPLEDSDDLARVAQFLGVHRDDAMYPKELIQRELAGVAAAGLRVGRRAARALAELPLPVFITTNYDDFMFEALATPGRTRRASSAAGTAARPLEGQPSRSLDPGSPPTPGEPARLPPARPPRRPGVARADRGRLPRLPRRRLARRRSCCRTRSSARWPATSLLFIGYRLADWDFRVLHRGLVMAGEPSLRRLSVTVQLKPAPTPRAGLPRASYFGAMKRPRLLGHGRASSCAELRRALARRSTRCADDAGATRTSARGRSSRDESRAVLRPGTETRSCSLVVAAPRRAALRGVGRRQDVAAERGRAAAARARRSTSRCCPRCGCGRDARGRLLNACVRNVFASPRSDARARAGSPTDARRRSSTRGAARSAEDGFAGAAGAGRRPVRGAVHALPGALAGSAASSSARSPTRSRRDPLLRVLLAIREDYLAQLDAVRAAPPGAACGRACGSSALAPDAAMAAVTEPADRDGRSFCARRGREARRPTCCGSARHRTRREIEVARRVRRAGSAPGRLPEPLGRASAGRGEITRGSPPRRSATSTTCSRRSTSARPSARRRPPGRDGAGGLRSGSRSAFITRSARAARPRAGPSARPAYPAPRSTSSRLRTSLRAEWRAGRTLVRAHARPA